MSKFEVIFYQNRSRKIQILDFINKLTVKDKAKITWILKLLMQYGKSLSNPYLKFLRNSKNIWELRPKNYRIFLSFIEEKNIILLHIIVKKTNKTPKKDIELAQKRLDEYLRRK